MRSLAQGAFTVVQPFQQRQALLTLPPQDCTDFDRGRQTASAPCARDAPRRSCLAGRSPPTAAGRSRPPESRGPRAARRTAFSTAFRKVTIRKWFVRLMCSSTWSIVHPCDAGRNARSSTGRSNQPSTSANTSITLVRTIATVLSCVIDSRCSVRRNYGGRVRRGDLVHGFCHRTSARCAVTTGPRAGRAAGIHRAAASRCQLKPVKRLRQRRGACRYTSARPRVSGIHSHAMAARTNAAAVTENAAPNPFDAAREPTTNGATALARRPML